jgi:S-formylglutathione hydrolase FrmB
MSARRGSTRGVRAIALLGALWLVAACGGPAGASPAEGRVLYGEAPSESLGAPLRFAVSLPASYDREPSRRYPLVVFLHGLFNSEKDWEGRGVEAAVEQLRESKKIGDFIVAIPYGANSFYLNGKDGTKYEDAIVRDFIPYVDKTYRTTGKADERVIEGISMGGFGALVIGFKHPEMFAGVVAHSAAIFGDLPTAPGPNADRRAAGRYQMAAKIFGDPPDRDFFRANNPLDLATANAAKIKKLKIYFDVGEQDRYGFAEGNHQLDATLAKAGVEHVFYARPGDHGWAFLLSRSEPAFTFVWHALGGK